MIRTPVDLSDAMIGSIGEYLVHGERAGLVFPFKTPIEEAEGVDGGLSEDEFFFLLDFYEGDGDQLLSDCVVIDEEGVASLFGLYLAEADDEPVKVRLSSADPRAVILEQWRIIRRNGGLQEARVMGPEEYFKTGATAAKTVDSKFKRGMIPIADITKTLKPLVAVLGATMVAAGVKWFKARHSREMLQAATATVLKESIRRGMYISPAEVRNTIKAIIRNPMKIRKITHAVEMAKSGIAIDRAAKLLAQMAIQDLGIDKMPIGKPASSNVSPSRHGRNVGKYPSGPKISAPTALEPFSF